MATMSGKRKQSRKGSRWIHLTDEEVLSIVVNLFCRGILVGQIVKHMVDFYGEVNFNREHPYKYLRRAAERGMLAFALSNGRDHGLERRIRETGPGLNTVEVVNSAVASDVAEHVATVFIEWVRNKAVAGQKQIRVGLMGGGTIMAVCRALAPALAGLAEDEKKRWPRLTFQALVVGDNVREPLEDPAAFFTYFADAALNPLRRNYVSLHAPVFKARQLGEHDLEAKEFEQLRMEARSCDIVLISAGALGDKHSFLGALQSSAPDVWQRLRKANCRGDLGRLPVSPEAPMQLDLFDHPPCTLVGLDDLQEMVRENRRVMLVAAPCGDCGAHKGDIIQTLLELREKGYKLFSDLICDSQSSRSMPRLNTGADRNGRAGRQ